MGWDLFGQLVGKDRRRQIEGDAAKLTQVNWGVLGTRLAFGVATGLLTATLHGSIPTTTGGLLTLAAGGLVAAGPSAFQAAGVFNAISPGTISAASAAAQGIKTILSAPKAQRQQELAGVVSQATLAAITAWQAKQDATQQAAGVTPQPQDAAGVFQAAQPLPMAAQSGSMFPIITINPDGTKEVAS